MNDPTTRGAGIFALNGHAESVAGARAAESASNLLVAQGASSARGAPRVSGAAAKEGL